MEPLPPRSRRSKTNLAHLSLAPLSTRMPIDSDGDDSPQETEHTVHVNPSGGDASLSSYHTWRSPSSRSRPHSPHYTSYIAGKSAPTTPRILSRGPSPNRQSTRKGKEGKGHSRGKSSKSFTALQSLDVSIPSGRNSGTQTPHSNPLNKVVTEPTTINLGLGAPLTKARTSGAHLPRSKSSKHAKSKSAQADNAEWLFRAGAAITEGARATKGQAWLVSRESSTSLAAAQQEDTYAQHSTDDEEAPRRPVRSPYASRSGSRAHSRSRRPNHLGSLTSSSSRADIAALRQQLVAGFTPVVQTPRYESGVPGPDLQPLTSASGNDDYFSQVVPERRRGSTPGAALAPGPDFVDLHNEPPSPFSGSSASYSSSSEDEDEVHRKEDAEVAALARTRGLGFGVSIIDRLVAWTLFAPHDADDQVRDTDLENDEQDIEDSDSDAGTVGYSSGVATPARGGVVPLTGAAVEAAKLTAAEKGKGKAVVPPPAPEKNEGGRLGDAAWLLSVASKVIF